MPSLLRHALIRLLLLAVFFHTVIGMPAHQAAHQQQAVAALAGAPAADEAMDAEHGSEVHAACAWCLAYAQLGNAPASLAAAVIAVPQAELPRPQAREAFVPDPCRWPFAARDPPRALA